jgi:hypothetical protein
MKRWKASFEVDGECSWEVDALTEEEARALATVWFRNAPFWAARYPVTPTCVIHEVRPEPERGPSHGDIGPFR